MDWITWLSPRADLPQLKRLPKNLVDCQEQLQWPCETSLVAVKQEALNGPNLYRC